jgi:alpha-amylase
MARQFMIGIAAVIILSCIDTGFVISKNPIRQRNSMSSNFKRVGWRNHTNVYEVNIRQYTPEGSFNAFAKQLPRLKKMGVETIWFMPITAISKEKRLGSLGSYYACSDYTAINPEFGTLDDFKNLVVEAHAMGFKVIIDWVANHTGWDHVWTKLHPDYYEKDSSGGFKLAPGMADIIELDYNNPAMVKDMITAMQFWVKECKIDGFRCDLASWVPLVFWQKARTLLDGPKPLFWLGEFDPLDSPDYMDVFDVAYTWTWMHKTEDFYKKQREPGLLLDVLKKYQEILPPETSGLFFTSNHDENTWNGTEYEKYGDMAKALAVFSCTWKGVPLVYSGQELPNLKRLKFFDKDQIAWTGKFELQEFYRKLLSLHSSHPALAAADKNVETTILSISTDSGILAFLRKKGEQEVLVLLNLSPYPSKFVLSQAGISGNFKELFSGQKKVCGPDSQFELPQWGYKVYFK